MPFICRRTGTKVKNVFICDMSGANPSGPDSPFSQGQLSNSYVKKYTEFFSSSTTTNNDEKVTIVHTSVKDIKDPSKMNFEEELLKWGRADLIVITFGLWWFSIPGHSKTYLDCLLNHGSGVRSESDKFLFKGDGRHADTPELGYASGGHLKNTIYMLNVTTNAPNGAYLSDRMEGELKNRRLDDILLPLHGTCQFLGMKKIPDGTFHAPDVHKNPKYEEDFKRWEKHMNDIFEKQTSTIIEE